MLKSAGWIVAVVIAGVLLLPGIVSAQTDDARQAVLDAVQATNALESYHLKLKSNLFKKFTQPSGSVTNYTLKTLEGDVGLNGDRHFTVRLQSGDGFENALKAKPLIIEQIVSGGITYINLQTENEIVISSLNIPPGWWESEKLLASLDNLAITALITEYSKADTPLETPLFYDNVVLNVEELEPEVQEDVSLRVFDMEMDAVQLSLELAAIPQEDREQVLAESQGLRDASEMSATYRLWIGRDDGLVYRGKGEVLSIIPFLTAGSDSGPDFDVEDSGTTEFSITQHGEAVAITPPDPATLNE